MKTKILFLAVFVIGFTACKKNDALPDTPGGTKPLGAGVIYYDWSTDGILKFDLATGTVSIFRQDDLSRNGWDVSIDGTQYLQAVDKSGGNYDTETFTLTRTTDGTILSQFDKESGYANSSFPKLSRDASLIAVSPTFDNGLMILDIQGTLLHHITGFQNQEIDRGNINWMPDNSVIFSIGKKICRTNPEFTQASVITELPFAEWNDLSVSPDGTRMAFSANNHIWMMDADGGNLVQVSTSDQVEVTPEFSPDGNWLVMGTDYRSTGPFGHIWRLVIVPADGQLYNVNEGADRAVIPLIRKGETRPEACSGGLVWR